MNAAATQEPVSTLWIQADRDRLRTAARLMQLGVRPSEIDVHPAGDLVVVRGQAFGLAWKGRIEVVAVKEDCTCGSVHESAPVDSIADLDRIAFGPCPS